MLKRSHLSYVYEHIRCSKVLKMVTPLLIRDKRKMENTALAVAQGALRATASPFALKRPFVTLVVFFVLMRA